MIREPLTFSLRRRMVTRPSPETSSTTLPCLWLQVVLGDALEVEGHMRRDSNNIVLVSHTHAEVEHLGYTVGSESSILL